jgi:hypothetical protein
MLTSQNPDTPEGLKSRLSVRIHRIPEELPHSTELPRGLLTSREVLQPSEPSLSLLYKNALGSTIEG